MILIISHDTHPLKRAGELLMGIEVICTHHSIPRWTALRRDHKSAVICSARDEDAIAMATCAISCDLPTLIRTPFDSWNAGEGALLLQDAKHYKVPLLYEPRGGIDTVSLQDMIRIESGLKPEYLKDLTLYFKGDAA